MSKHFKCPGCDRAVTIDPDNICGGSNRYESLLCPTFCSSRQQQVLAMKNPDTQRWCSTDQIMNFNSDTALTGRNRADNGGSSRPTAVKEERSRSPKRKTSPPESTNITLKSADNTMSRLALELLCRFYSKEDDGGYGGLYGFHSVPKLQRAKVAYVNGEVAGYYSYQFPGDTFEAGDYASPCFAPKLVQIYIMPKHRRKGLGAKMVLDFFKNSGVERKKTGDLLGNWKKTI